MFFLISKKKNVYFIVLHLIYSVLSQHIIEFTIKNQSIRPKDSFVFQTFNVYRNGLHIKYQHILVLNWSSKSALLFYFDCSQFVFLSLNFFTMTLLCCKPTQFQVNAHSNQMEHFAVSFYLLIPSIFPGQSHLIRVLS